MTYFTLQGFQRDSHGVTLYQWHYTEWAMDTWVDIGRALLGRLPDENARNVGYRTAEELFDIEVASRTATA